MRFGDVTIHDDGRVERAGGTLTTIADWNVPGRIPVVAAPGKLPPGIGAQILNAIAERATGPLRYAGPYPTPALYRALLRSFRTTASEAEFCADVLGRALRLASDELPYDFVPAPHRRIEHARGWSEIRDEVERVVIDGVSYDDGVARIVADRCEVWFGDAPYASVAELRDGVPIAFHDLPVSTSPVVGKDFPPPLRAAIADLACELVPPPLADDVRRVIAERAIRWADLGARAARYDDGFSLHAALWDRLSPHGLARVALGVAEALAPVATMRVLAELS